MKIDGVIFDWAGTTVDYGCFAPVQVFIDIFNEFDIKVTIDEVRSPMGLRKWDHISEIMKLPHISTQFFHMHNREVRRLDIDEMHQLFEPKLLAILDQYTKVNPYVVETTAQLREAGIKIGSTTGYSQTMLQIVAEAASKQGYVPDFMVAPDLVQGKGRPYPYMIYQNMLQLNLPNIAQIVKVGDTISDMEEARNAGAWSIGVVKGSSLLGLTEAEVNLLSDEQYQHKRQKVTKQYMDAGATFVIDDFSTLPNAIEQINEKLAKGDSPNERISS